MRRPFIPVAHVAALLCAGWPSGSGSGPVSDPEKPAKRFTFLQGAFVIRCAPGRCCDATVTRYVTWGTAWPGGP